MHSSLLLLLLFYLPCLPSYLISWFRTFSTPSGFSCRRFVTGLFLPSDARHGAGGLLRDVSVPAGSSAKTLYMRGACMPSPAYFSDALYSVCRH
jgi:hypothetical protein